MPLNARSISVNIAVMSFFVLGFVCWFRGLPPVVCCRRAIIGSVIAYIAGMWFIKIINVILMDAVITRQAEKEKTQHQDEQGES